MDEKVRISPYYYYAGIPISWSIAVEMSLCLTCFFIIDLLFRVNVALTSEIMKNFQNKPNEDKIDKADKKGVEVDHLKSARENGKEVKMSKNEK